MEKQEKAYKGVIEYFKNRIMAGELRPGEKLPGGKRLCARNRTARLLSLRKPFRNRVRAWRHGRPFLCGKSFLGKVQSCLNVDKPC